MEDLGRTHGWFDLSLGFGAFGAGEKGSGAVVLVGILRRKVHDAWTVSSLSLVGRKRALGSITKICSCLFGDYQPERRRSKWPVICISRGISINIKHNSNQSTQSELSLLFPSFLPPASCHPTISAFAIHIINSKYQYQ